MPLGCATSPPPPTLLVAASALRSPPPVPSYTPPSPKCRVMKPVTYGKITAVLGRGPRSLPPRSKSPVSASVRGSSCGYVDHTVPAARQSLRRLPLCLLAEPGPVVAPLGSAPLGSARLSFSSEQSASRRLRGVERIRSCCRRLPLALRNITVFIDMLEVEVNGTPASQLSTPLSRNSPSPAPTSPGSLNRRREKDMALSECRPSSS
ncbi:unnamed protein product [Arctogadus glacialis]